MCMALTLWLTVKSLLLFVLGFRMQDSGLKLGGLGFSV